MSAISQTISNLFNGITEQPPVLRSPSQASVQDNYDSSLVRGVFKRNPTINIGYMTSLATAKGYFHLIDRTPTEKWAILLNGTEILAMNALTGATVPVVYMNSVGTLIPPPAYVVSSNPQVDFKLLTVADYTFVLNKTVIGAMDSPLATGTLLGTVQRFTDLPSPATGLYKVQGDAAGGFNYYFVWGNGTTWTEIAYPEIRKPLGSSLPRKLIRYGTGFALQEISYGYSNVGDATINPNPTFIGRTIQDVFFYRNRLGFITADSIVLSRAGDYFNFYPKTMTAVLDDDPIDEQMAHPKIVNLKHAVPFASTLMLFGDTVQFMFTGGDVLAPGKARIDAVTEFDCGNAQPVGIGPNLYFTQPTGSSTRIREYYIEQERLTSDADDITKHVPEFIPVEVSRLASSSAEDALVVLNESNLGELRVYRQQWQGDKRIQSAWFKFSMDNQFADLTKILGVAFSGSVLYLLISRGTGTSLEKLDFSTNALKVTDGDGDKWPILLDRLNFYRSGGYDPVTDTTTWVLPYSLHLSVPVQVVETQGWAQSGLVLNCTRPSTNECAARGDWSSLMVAAGVPYTATYELSPLYARDKDGVPQTAGRLQVRNLEVHLKTSGYLRCDVIGQGRDVVSRAFSPGTVGLLFAGYSQVEDAIPKFAVMGDGTKTRIALVNDTPYPTSIHALNWTGFYSQRTKSI